MRYAESVTDLIGHTPLVRLQHLAAGTAATVLVKLEYLNPGGSVKDRIAARMIEAAEAEGLLRPGGTIVEPTSGNTGVGLALVAQRKGYRCIFVAPDKVAEDKLAVLRAYGAEVVVTPTAVPPESPESYYGVSDRLVREIPGAYKPDQFANPHAPLSHYASTGPEIWADTAGRVTHVVVGAGTGGTITGTGRYLKEVSGGAVKVIAADPAGSVYSGGSGRPFLVEGVGEDMWPDNYDPTVPDEVLAVTDAESFAMTRRLAAEEGMLVGGSSGMAVSAALRVAQDLPADAVVVVIAPDSGRGYLAKIFDDGWMRRHGFAVPTRGAGAGASAVGDGPATVGRPTVGDGPATVGHPAVGDGHATAGDVLAGSDPLPYLSPEAGLAEATAVLEDHGLDRLPVLAAPPPARLGEVRGSVSATGLARALFAGAPATDPVADHLEEPLPTVGAGEPLSVLRERLTATDAVLVLAGGEAVGLLTRRDLLRYARPQEES